MASAAPILLTPGPLTTSERTRAAMLTDWGSWDGSFNGLTASVCDKLVAIANGSGSHVCVPLQGSGTFAVEAAVGTFVPRSGKMLVLVNGAYGKRLARICEMLGRDHSIYETPEDVPTTPEAVDRLLSQDRALTHVGLIHCETSTGILNPLPEIAAVVARHGRRLIIDAMSSFGALPIDARAIPFEALIAASGKCLEGVPGMGFVLAREEALLAAEGNIASLALDLRDQHLYMQRTGQWRFTPPTHVVAALHEALLQYEDEGGLAARHARYARNCRTLITGMARLGLRSFLAPEIQAPIIVTFHAPRDGRYRFGDFYEAVRAKGFILYPGKLTRVETFRVGCIGAVEPADMERAVEAVAETFRDLDIEIL
ncbi:2-aminoethylphosphonate--pyruvate transaminase [Methylobacterium gregans]|uniref:2-aminoethylphosphonate--pyruvate transaminase n=1 Tax=Methylobacterium gregans TaxID=374424 RepID=A0AA37HML3_9HYPH|nr:2-aminoethylphosphonate--pyruvate transaminase [Methylobacterium gregans]MDQ0523638.1 2-aminoethylphosphonate-pyruvate transaminase [Methylobacterium gregans]GJD78230.1 2-aminoethylphosphonate--pyruvate transaminase [Methylobacterium gregans]GLS55553.1 2-aminoethylphosphonate--pyruvate transaminase [Methylobacterium gregans]